MQRVGKCDVVRGWKNMRDEKGRKFSDNLGMKECKVAREFYSLKFQGDGKNKRFRGNWKM